MAVESPEAKAAPPTPQPKPHTYTWLPNKSTVRGA